MLSFFYSFLSGYFSSIFVFLLINKCFLTMLSLIIGNSAVILGEIYLKLQLIYQVAYMISGVLKPELWGGGVLIFLINILDDVTPEHNKTYRTF